MQLSYGFKTNCNKHLDKLSSNSKNLYNQANYIVRNNFIVNNNYLNYYDMCKQMRNVKNLEGQINYKTLPAQTSQQILKQLDSNWLSYFRSIKDYKINPNKYRGIPHMPGYIKNKKNILILTNQQVKIKKNKISIKKYNIFIKIPRYKDKTFEKFNQIRILPRKKHYVVEIIYEQEIIDNKLDKSKILSIDLGVNNLLSCTTNDENKPFIINGRGMKSINQLYNKRLGKLKSIRSNGHDSKSIYSKTTNRMNSIYEYRNDYIQDKMHQVSKFIINYCISKNIGRICVGELTGIKTSSKLSKSNNQQFQQLPIQLLKQKLKYKCELNSIEYIEVDESYTSKCSALDLEPIMKHEEYIGNREKRGLFVSKKFGLINADINGSLNIMRKVLGDKEFSPLVNSRIWYNPVKIREINPHSFEQFLLKTSLPESLFGV